MREEYFTVKEVIEKYIQGCRSKVQMASKCLLGKSIMAGAMIAMGAGISSVAAHTISDVGLARLIAAIVFPVGFMMVIMLGAELFTGDCLVAMSIFDKQQTIKSFIRLLSLVYIGNFIGSAMISLFVSLSGQWNYSGGMLGSYTIKVALAKVNISFSQGIISGILCNILVCMAVLMVMCSKDITGKLLASFFMIMLFATSGFEHCVANMYYITSGLIAKTNPQYVKMAIDAYGFSKDYIESLNIINFLIKNLLPVTIGNIIGGVVFVAAPVYYLNNSKIKSK